MENIWKKWGPYLSERQWGTVREDYSSNGDAWSYFPHDHARSRAYRWGEDGIAGISDEKQRLCFALSFWNGKDPILKERLFGLTNTEGNHGEDVKECYFYLDNTPTHYYMKYLYKYPQQAFPYDDLVQTNRSRTRSDPEYELIDTGVFDENRYFDIFIEYAKVAPEDILIRITAWNRGPEPAPLFLLPTLWFRNTWSWFEGQPKPSLEALPDADGMRIIRAHHPELDPYNLYTEGSPLLLFTENENNNQRLFSGENASPYVKDAFHTALIHGQKDATNPGGKGTKACALHYSMVNPGSHQVMRLRLTSLPQEQWESSFEGNVFGDPFDHLFEQRIQTADAFYASITPPGLKEDEARLLRQGMAGMLWSKQYYYFNVEEWIKEHGEDPFSVTSRYPRNGEWFHMINDDIISMPDKWEYPWYAAWDLAFHAVAFSIIDPDFAKHQLQLILQPRYMHPNGQIPAYEWNFSDVNPPVHAWAALYIYNTERKLRLHDGDIGFLKQVFQRLLLNFTWWVNRKDMAGKNIFEGGFLGLDNIGIFDRSKPLPTGGSLEQADGTAWMALFCQNMLEIAVELSTYDSSYEDMVIKFSEHFFWIASSLNHQYDSNSLWDDEDGFYYDAIRFPDGHKERLKVRSLVGILPLCATMIMEKYQRDRIPQIVEQLSNRFKKVPSIFNKVHPTGEGNHGIEERGIFSLLTPERLKKMLHYILDENEFLSPYGIRSLSKYHQEHPYSMNVHGVEYRIDYQPAESDSGLFGGNSNWRGPIWFPMNIMVIRALLQFYLYYGDTFKVECPTGSGHLMNLFEVSHELSHRLTGLFLQNQEGKRAEYGNQEKFQSDPHWKNLILFHEYFNGESGVGLGASHQTGWTGLASFLIQVFGHLDAQVFLEKGKKADLHFPSRKQRYVEDHKMGLNHP